MTDFIYTFNEWIKCKHTCLKPLWVTEKSLYIRFVCFFIIVILTVTKTVEQLIIIQKFTYLFKPLWVTEKSMYIWLACFFGFFNYCDSYRHIETLPSSAHIHYNMLQFVCRMSLLHTRDCMLYYTCLHTVPMCIPVYSYHCFCHKLFRYNVLDIVNCMYFPSNQTYSWYKIHLYCHRSVRHNLQGIAIHMPVSSIRLHIHRHSFQSHYIHYFCKLPHILEFIN